MLPTTQFADWKGLGTCDDLLCVADSLQSALELGQEAIIVEIDFIAAFDRVNHQGILFKLCSVGVRSSVLSVRTQFLSNRSQYVVVDGCRCKLVNVVSRVPQGSVLGPQLFLLYTAELFSIMENKLYGYADDSTLVAVVPSLGERIAVSGSMNRDLNRVSVWCNLWGMKLNANKNNTMIVSGSRTVLPQLTPLTLDVTVLKKFADLVILGVTFDAEMTFEKHLRSVSSGAAQRLGIMRKSWQVFHDRSLLVRSFRSFLLPVLEYCSAVWCSAAKSHLKLLDRVVRSAGFLAGCVLECNLAHRRSVAEFFMLFKIKIKITRGALVAHRHSFATPHCRTSQYRRSVVPLSVERS